MIVRTGSDVVSSPIRLALRDEVKPDSLAIVGRADRGHPPSGCGQEAMA